MPKTPKTAEKKKDVTAAAATASPAGKVDHTDVMINRYID